MTEKSAADHKADGNAAFAAKQYDKAVEAFTAAISLAPTDHVLYSNRSGAHASLGDYAAALKDAEECIRLAPQWVKGYSRKGLALLQQGKIVEAMQAYGNGVKLDPSNAACTQGFQQCLMKMQEGQGGMEELQEYLRAAEKRQQPHQQPQHQQQPSSHSNASEPRRYTAPTIPASIFDESPAIKKYIAEDPTFLGRVTEALSAMAMSNGQQQPSDPRVAEAVQYFALRQEAERMAAEEKRKDAELAATQRRQQEQQAREAAAREAAKTPEQREADALKEQGNALYKQRKFAEAVALYEQAAKIYPQDLTYRANKSTALLESGDIQAALQELDAALEQRTEVQATFESVAKLYAKKAAAYMRLKDYPRAIEAYEKSLLEHNTRQVRAALADAKRAADKAARDALIDPVKAEEYRQKGNELFKAGDHAAAKELYDRAVEAAPQDARCYANRAAALLALVALPSALQDCEKSLELDSTVAKVWARKGTILSMMKEFNKAMTAFQRGLQVEPSNQQCLDGLRNVQMKIAQSNFSDKIDEDQVKRAMADPEIQGILADPQFRLILSSCQEDPMRAQQAMSDPQVAAKMQKLMAAGILKIA